MTIIHTPANVEKVATEFLLELAEWMRLDERPEIQTMNMTPDFVRNANDYYDANMAMDAAFKRCGLVALEDGPDSCMSSDVADLWNEAWERAAKMCGMKTCELKNGIRATLNNDVEAYPTGFFPKGLTGTIEQVDLDGDIVAMFRLDEKNPNLDNEEDRNCLQVGKNDDEFIMDASYLTLIERRARAR